jgi:glycosyltransferase involved in cell wall biosynthesis
MAMLAAEKELSSNKYDAIFVSAPPFSTFPISVRLKEKFNIPLILDYRDLWVGNQFSFNPTPYHKKRHKNLEYKCLKKSDKIIVINRKIKEKLLTFYKFLSFDDVEIIPQGFDAEDFERNAPLPKSNDKIHITYSGIFYEKITPKYFLKAFKKLSFHRPDIAENIELHFIGHFRKENRKLVKKLKLQEFVKEHGYLDHNHVIQRIKSADILWAMVGKGKGYETVALGKLFEYFGTKKPIIVCAPEGAAKSAAKEYKAAFIADPEDIDEIMNIFIEINKLYKLKTLPIPNEEFINKHERKLLTEQLIKQFQFKL